MHEGRVDSSKRKRKKKEHAQICYSISKERLFNDSFLSNVASFCPSRPVFSVVEAQSKGGHPPRRFVWREYVSVVYSSCYFRGDTSIRYSGKFRSATSQQSRGPRKKGRTLSAPPYPSFFLPSPRGIDVRSVNKSRRKIVNRPTRYFYLWILREL